MVNMAESVLTLRGRTRLFRTLLSVVALPLALSFSFTQNTYNATIYENSLSLSYVLTEEKMGIFTSDSTLDIKYKIAAGDDDKFFKSESRLVGDFSFLIIRTRAGHHDVLNRERRDFYTLDIRASAKTRGRQQINLRAKTEVNIRVLDTNDLNPIFSMDEYKTEIPEDFPLHKNLLKVSASDADIGINGEVYYSFAEPNEQFAVHPTSGEISLTQPLNFHRQRSYKLKLIAQDRGPKKTGHFVSASAAIIFISVRQVNLHDPLVRVRHLPSVVEDSNVDIYAIIKVIDEDEGVHGEVSKIEIINGDPDGHFRIQPGKQQNEYNIAVLNYLDREVAPYGYNLTLKVTDKGVHPRSSLKDVRVRVTDLNDHAPQFPKKEYRVSVEEIAPINTPILRVTAHDTDIGRNAQVTYEIISGNDDNKFAVNPLTGLLITVGVLDAEGQLKYELTVMATDQANSGMRKSNTTKVIVTVLDNNDEDPIFLQTPKEILINENEPAGYLVYKVKALDNDQGENGYVSYSIANLTPTPFVVDHFSGEIRTNEVIDYETMRRVYVLKIRASDWGMVYRRQTEMLLRIVIQNVNDNRPQFEKVDCSGYISLKMPIHSEVFTVSAVDFDSDKVSYRVVSGNEDHCFELDEASGMIKLACNPEDIGRNERYLNITASDGQNFADTMAVKIVIGNGDRNLKGNLSHFECRDSEVIRQFREMLKLAEKNNQHNNEDVLPQLPMRFGLNRHKPEFKPSMPSRVAVNESTPVGSVILAVKAADKDLGYNGQLIYVISGGDLDSCFQVDMHSGILRVFSPLDREKRSHYLLNISVYDLGKPQKSAWQMLDVDILDVNDNPPVFIKSSFSVNVVEDALNGTPIARVKATDRDTGINAVVSYSLVTSNSNFAVHPESGAVTVNSRLDREKQDMYELKILASDGSPDKPLSSTAIVRVRILDVNDNPPHFPLSQYVVRIREDVPKGTVVIALSAIDPDLNSGGRVEYSIASGNEEGVFVIDKEYGTIRLGNQLDFESKQIYNLSVSARDKGSPSLSTATNLVVEVMDVNENQHAPKFGDFVAEGSVKENLPVGTFVMHVNATDDDEVFNHNGNIMYSIRDGNGMGHFFIDQEGNIYTSDILDRETTQSYWLTVYAQDRGTVPLFSRLEIYIEVLDENDNTPQTVDPSYYPRVPENSPLGTPVVQIEAYDKDENPHKKLSFRISNGNSQGYFAIDSDTGLISTTGRHLDREHQEEHILEVTVSDNGEPELRCTTHVVVSVTDVNDHGPIFSEQLYHAWIPELSQHDMDTALFQVIAIDRDVGTNAEIEYTIKSRMGNGRFRINQKTGMIYSHQNFTAGNKYELQIQAADNGSPRHVSLTRVMLEVVQLPSFSIHPPIIENENQIIRINENEAVGYLITMIKAQDYDDDLLWYSFTEGNTNDTFMIKRESGEIILIRNLDWETKSNYNLTVQVTDGVHSVYTQLYIIVIDYNDNWPQFSETTYLVEISENIPIATEIMQVEASDRDEDKRLFYAFHSSSNTRSMRKFQIDSSRGIISTTEKLDQEACHQHELIILVKDYGTPAHYNYTRVVIAVKDHNDHSPLFLAEKFEGLVCETAAIGTAVVQVLAVDRDKGKNAEIRFSFISGNIGGIFAIDEKLGIVSVVKELSLKSLVKHEYVLIVKAVDQGEPPLGSIVPVHIVVTMADNAPPKFDKSEYSTEVKENAAKGTYVIDVHAVSKSTVYYQIVSGNNGSHFEMNPNSGILFINQPIDYERNKFFNLTIQGINMVQKFAKVSILIHVLDVNDNSPRFTQKEYFGNISETAVVGSLVMIDKRRPLVVSAEDLDSDLNSLLIYSIVEKGPNKFFTIEANTGAIRSISNLDSEQTIMFNFHVQVSDMGKPQLTAEVAASVTIYVDDVNDCAPMFEYNEYNASLLLPTYKDVIVIALKAADGDVNIPTVLKYSIISGNIENKFTIDGRTGIITVKDENNLMAKYILTVQVSDGKYSSMAEVNVAVNSATRSGLLFSEETYFANVIENKSDVMTVVVITVLGSSLDEHLDFSILNPNTMFTIGNTSGVIHTSGKAFDREVQDTYALVVQVRSELQHRVAQVTVLISIMDVNDNSPIFINLPYFAVVPINTKEGDTILKVQAIDKDIGDNGEVRYELSDGDKEYFRLNSKSGDLSLRKTLQETNKEFKLLVTAYDKGMEPRHTEVNVTIRVISHSMPVFNQQFYSSLVPENIQPFTPVLSVHADSPDGRKLIYSITGGNSKEEFAVDFSTGVIYIVDELDFETRKFYQLTVEALDAVSGARAEVLVSITVEDINDNAPEFPHSSYQATILETALPGTVLLELSASDKDSGMNQMVHYILQTDHMNANKNFQIHSTTGVISIKDYLNREEVSSYHLMVIACDSGVPSLNSSAHVWVSVLDINDNPPKFEQPSYQCFLNELAIRGQFVTIVTAFDPDPSDQNNLKYAIVGGNDQQCFSINPGTGIIIVKNLRKCNQESAFSLNISVSDGVHNSFARVKIDLLSSNKNAPHFEKITYDIYFEENQPIGSVIGKVTAVDEDQGEFGHIIYSIQSDASKEYFDINPQTGEITSKAILDRESQPLFEVPLLATDGGGQLGYALLRVFVDDVNDNPPQFKLSEYRANVPANTSMGTTIVQIQAVDKDFGVSAKVQYTIYEPNVSESNIADVFGINRDSGEIFLKKSALLLENQIYQFFVRGRDFGMPSMESDVPVEIYIISPQDTPPKFEEPSNQHYIIENAPFGTVITTLNAHTHDYIKYSIVSLMNNQKEDKIFAVDEAGQLVVTGLLDREQTDAYLLTVCAETESTPPLTAFTDVTIHLIDENDNDPIFESNPYKVSIAENSPEGSTVLKVVAHDPDLGHNADIRYALGPNIGNVLNVFAIDSVSGWITVMVPLDRETTPYYLFLVTATDNGNPPRSSSTYIHIEVQDYNDNPPVFTQDKFQAAVNEDALPGTVVIAVSTIDADTGLNSRIQYYITAGDIGGYFQIQHSGEISVHRELDRETKPFYTLEVTATDGIFVTKTNIYIEILDANDNPPICKKVRYREKILENIPIGVSILKLEASDEDELHNSRFKYFLSGEKSSSFTVDQTGHLKIAKTVDRELYSRYHLIAHIQDREISEWECTSEIILIVLDVNDNAPEFTQEVYSFTVPEDLEVQTLIGKVHATDRDLGLNRKIKYSLPEPIQEHFTIDEKTGLISLAKSIDREEQALFNLTLKATDHGKPPLSSFSRLIIVVLDINDSPPEFSTHLYQTRVLESAPPGSDVGNVFATSQDTGINAEISYSIVSGNEHGKFTIHPKTGVITVVDHLDYEKSREYFLTIQANDGGIPSLSNQANVNVTVIDVNDNWPVFSQSSYSTGILENARVGEDVLQVVATDLDGPPNNHISYYIVAGNEKGHFEIDKQTGNIVVRQQLDRETTASYQLYVQGIDHGIPNLSSNVSVNIEINDVNDNPPVFSSKNYSAYIQEDKPIGYTVLKFTVSDADAPPNGSPFTFDIISGNFQNEFHISRDGILTTSNHFNRNIRDLYTLQIRVFDNGIPPLYSIAKLKVQIIEESLYEPIVLSLEVIVSSYMDEFPGGVLGQIKATDQDPYDKLQFSLESDYQKVFKIDPDDGTLTAQAGLDAGSYMLNVIVSDGKYKSYGLVTVEVHLITEQMLEYAVIVRFESIKPESFIVSYCRLFKKTVQNILSLPSKSVEIISIQPASQLSRSKRYNNNQDLDVAFAVRRGFSGFFRTDQVRKALYESKSALETSLDVKIVKIHKNLCTNERCFRGDCHDRFILDEKVVISVIADTQSYVCPQHYHITECHCEEGFSGEKCDIVVNECAQDPCPSPMTCTPDSSERGFFCHCPEEDNFCKDSNECSDRNCVKEKNPIFFHGKSYARYTLVNAMDKYFTFSVRIRTGQLTGCLKYAAGRIDYSILEIVNGIIQYRFNCGSGEGTVRVKHIHINDGKWHEIALNRYGNTAELILDGKSSAQGSTPGSHDILNIDSNDIYFGAEVHPHPTMSGYEDLRMGFIGCMDDIRIDRIGLPLHISNGNSVAVLRRFTNIEFHCILSLDLGVCGSQPCFNGGTCKPTDDSYVCHCHTRFIGARCEFDTNPCASNPCLHSGTCSNLENDFLCECLDGLSGKRCEFGRHCNPNPCRHNGVCEEGTHGPICKCHGFQGDLCQIDIDECLRNPCLNGGRCLNIVGSFICECEPNATGPLCDSIIPRSSITSNNMNITVEEIIGIITTVIIIILFTIIFVIVKKIHAKHIRQRRHDTIFDQKDLMLKNKNHDVIKRSKLSNIEAMQMHLIVPPLPASYNPHCHETVSALNNYDSLRNYSETADEIENQPKTNVEFLQNISKKNATNVHSTLPPNQVTTTSESLRKPSWDVDHNLKESYPETKIHNDNHCDNWTQEHIPMPDITEVPLDDKVPGSFSGGSNNSDNQNDSNASLSDAEGTSVYNANLKMVPKRSVSFDQAPILKNYDSAGVSDSHYACREYCLQEESVERENEENGNRMENTNNEIAHSMYAKSNDPSVSHVDNMPYCEETVSTSESCSDLAESLCEMEDEELYNENEPVDKKRRQSYTTVATRV